MVTMEVFVLFPLRAWLNFRVKWDFLEEAGWNETDDRRSFNYSGIMSLIESQIINLRFMRKLCGDSVDSAVAEKKAQKSEEFIGMPPTQSAWRSIEGISINGINGSCSPEASHWSFDNHSRFLFLETYESLTVTKNSNFRGMMIDPGASN